MSRAAEGRNAWRVAPPRAAPGGTAHAREGAGGAPHPLALPPPRLTASSPISTKYGACSCSSCSVTLSRAPPDRFQYTWLHRLKGVGASGAAENSMTISLPGVRRYSAVTTAAPGKPSSPSWLAYVKTAPTVPSGHARSADSHTTLLSPLTPPCRLFAPLFAATVYDLPPTVKAALAMRLATRPTVAPKYDVAARSASRPCGHTVTSSGAPPPARGTLTDVTVAPYVTTSTDTPLALVSVMTSTRCPLGIMPYGFDCGWVGRVVSWA